MTLSTHFPLEEMTRSATAQRLGIANTPTRHHYSRLITLAGALEIVRKACGNRPVLITSGYRNPAVNEAVGGVENSAHAQAYAADFHIPPLKIYDVAVTISQIPDFRFDQLILESDRGVVHLSVDPQFRMEVLTQPGGPGTATMMGLVRP